MNPRRRTRCVAAAGTALLALGLAGCEREQRELRGGPPSRVQTGATATTDLQPGSASERAKVSNPYEGNVHAINEGRRLYSWFNCIGCHAAGGGGMGPPLMDEKWIYGSDADEIHDSILQGRPNGMPSFRGKLTEDNAWKITAYVRSLSGLGNDLPQGTRSVPLQEKASANLDKGSKAVKEYKKEAKE